MSERPRRTSNADADPDVEGGFDPATVQALRSADGLASLETEGLLGTLERQLGGELARERGSAAWLRARPTPLRALIAGGAALLVALIAASAAGRPDLAVYPPARMAAVLLVASAALVVSLALALRPLHRPAPPRWAVPATAGLGLLGLFALYLLPAVTPLDPAHLQAPGVAAVFARAAPCFGIGLSIGLAMYALWRLLDRGGVWRTVAAALAAGLTANIALQLHCPVTAPLHLLTAHLGAALGIIALGIIARR